MSDAGPDRITQLEKVILSDGNKTDFPAIGAMIEMHYSGYLYDKNNAPEYKGKK
jgi:hypothetical protein